VIRSASERPRLAGRSKIWERSVCRGSRVKRDLAGTFTRRFQVPPSLLHAGCTVPSSVAVWLCRSEAPLRASVKGAFDAQGEKGEVSMAFWVTAFQNAYNARGGSLLFINAENSRNNRVINPGQITSVDNCWVPWCFREYDFPWRHIEIIDQDTDRVLWYIWQQDNNPSQGRTTMVCASRTGFEQPGPAIGGDSTVGTSYNIVIGPADDDLTTTPL